MCICQDGHDILNLKSEDAKWYVEYNPAFIKNSIKIKHNYIDQVSNLLKVKTNTKQYLSIKILTITFIESSRALNTNM